MNVRDYRRFYDFGKAVGKDFPPLRSSAARNPKPLFPSPRTLRQVRLRHLWDSHVWKSSLSHLPCLRPPQTLPQAEARVQSLQPPHLRRPASPPCPTSPSLIVSTMSRSLNQKLSRLTIRSTSRTGTSKWCAARPSSASTVARCHSTLPYSVRCFHRQTSPLSSLPTGARALCPPIHQPISRLF